MRFLIIVIMVLMEIEQALAACDYSKLPVFQMAYKNESNKFEKGNFTLKEINEKYPEGACEGWSPIIVAAAEGHLEIVKALIAGGAKGNDCLRKGGTRDSCMYLFDAALGKKYSPLQ